MSALRFGPWWLSQTTTQRLGLGLADALDAEKARADKLTEELDWFDCQLADERTAHQALRDKVKALADEWRGKNPEISFGIRAIYEDCAQRLEALLAQNNQEATNQDQRREPRSYFDVVRSITRDPDVLRAVDEVEAEEQRKAALAEEPQGGEG